MTSVQVRDRSLSPARAEVWVTVRPARRTPATEVRGRLTGPRCPYSTCIEVAYPFRPLPQPPAGADALTMRVVIPEPSWWEPASPFLYEGPVELWQDGRRIDQVIVRHGLRAFGMGPGGLRVNGRPLAVRGTEAPAVEAEVLQARQNGFNLLLASVESENSWGLADRLGFLVLGRMPSAEQLARAAGLDQHASCLGFLLPETALAEAASIPRQAGVSPFLGVELSRVPAAPLPGAVDFVACAEDLLPHLQGVHVPKLLLAPAEKSDGGRIDEPAPPSGVMGRVRRP